MSEDNMRRTPILARWLPRKIQMWAAASILVAAAPGLTISIVQHWRHYSNSLRLEKDRLQDYAAHVADRFATIIANGEELLRGLVHSPCLVATIRSEDENVDCPKFLTALHKEFPKYTNFSLVDRRKYIVCSSGPLARPVDVSTAKVQITAFETGRFAVSEFLFGPLTRRLVLVLAQPILGADGGVGGTLNIGVSMEWFSLYAGTSIRHTDVEVFLVDPSGLVMAAYPQEAAELGAPLRSKALMESLSKLDPRTDPVDVEGQRRIVATARFVGVPGGVTILVTRPERSVIDPLVHTLIADLVMTLGFVSLLAFAAWRAVGRVVTRPAVDLATKIGGWDPETPWAKRQTPRGIEEFQAIEDGFDRLSRRLSARLSDLREARSVAQNRSDRLERLAAHLEREKARAEAALGAKGRFLATMTHELRTPLAGLLGTLDLAADPDVKGPELKSYLAEAVRSGQRLLTTISEILEFTKVAQDDVAFSLQPTNVAEEIAGVFELAGLTARRKSLTLSAVHPPSAPARVSIDRVRYRQILTNLVNNAISFTTAGGVSVGWAWHPGTGHEGVLETFVSDTGVGIAKADLDRLFQPFSQVNDGLQRQSAGGTGLGLALCKELVTRLGGKIGVESEVGVGSRFWFHLPTRPAPPPDAAPSALLQVSDPEPASTPVVGCQILVAEDDETNQLVITTHLQRLGHQPVVAPNGQVALDLVTGRQHQFDLILMDVHMPILDGVAATEAIHREMAGEPLPPIVALTASPSALEANPNRVLFADVVGKPISRRQLGKLIQSLTTRAEPRSNDAPTTQAVT